MASVNKKFIALYYQLPYPLKVVVATLQGWHLRHWRYGPDTDRQAAEATERETWSPKQWQAWQEERLGRLLHRAATRVPYYRVLWDKRRRQGDRASWEYLENWPILEKEPIRVHPRALVADDCDTRKMYCLHTSGTSGFPLDIWWSRQTVRTWYAWFEARWRHWYGVSRHDRWAILGGALVAPIQSRKPPFWVLNAAMNQLYMSSYHLAPDLISYYLEALERYRITYLWGYTSSLYSLALEVLRRNRRDLRLKVAFPNAEPLYDYQKQAIAAAFHCPAPETYGMVEAVAAAGECRCGNLHLWPEVGIVEVMAHDRAAAPGEFGDFICTGLLNADMPLIRYRVGDRGALPAQPVNCPCGRTLPLLAQVEGRIDDVILTPDGRRVGRLSPVWKELPIREAQVIQEVRHKVRLRYIPAPEFTPAAQQEMVEKLRARIGPMEVNLEPMEEIPRDANGKFRSIVCKLPIMEKGEQGEPAGGQ